MFFVFFWLIGNICVGQWLTPLQDLQEILPSRLIVLSFIKRPTCSWLIFCSCRYLQASFGSSGVSSLNLLIPCPVSVVSCNFGSFGGNIKFYFKCIRYGRFIIGGGADSHVIALALVNILVEDRLSGMQYCESR